MWVHGEWEEEIIEDLRIPFMHTGAGSCPFHPRASSYHFRLLHKVKVREK